MPSDPVRVPLSPRRAPVAPSSSPSPAATGAAAPEPPTAETRGPTMLDEERCWQAICARDAGQDGCFVYGVVTTGVYCRPSCATPRRALRRNVRFFVSSAEAERAGLRACKRCRPDGDAADPIAGLCRDIASCPDEAGTLAAMAARVHMSPSTLQRRFKARVGVTPHQYAEACRRQALRRGLRECGSVTEAIADAGYGSASRVYEHAATHLGMTPRQYRDRGRGVAISWAVAETPLGALMLAATDRGLCFAQFGDDETELCTRLRAEYPEADLSPMPAAMGARFEAWRAALADHLASGGPTPTLPLDVRGTAFQIRVWRYLLDIPSGTVLSYAEVARGVGAPEAVRAVAGACARNPVALLIPCHRVIRGDGGLGGYRWGLARKRALLDAERRAARAAP